MTMPLDWILRLAFVGVLVFILAVVAFAAEAHHEKKRTTIQSRAITTPTITVVNPPRGGRAPNTNSRACTRLSNDREYCRQYY